MHSEPRSSLETVHERVSEPLVFYAEENTPSGASPHSIRRVTISGTGTRHPTSSNHRAGNHLTGETAPFRRSVAEFRMASESDVEILSRGSHAPHGEAPTFNHQRARGANGIPRNHNQRSHRRSRDSGGALGMVAHREDAAVNSHSALNEAFHKASAEDVIIHDDNRGVSGTVNLAGRPHMASAEDVIIHGRNGAANVENRGASRGVNCEVIHGGNRDVSGGANLAGRPHMASAEDVIIHKRNGAANRENRSGNRGVSGGANYDGRPHMASVEDVTIHRRNGAASRESIVRVNHGVNRAMNYGMNHGVNLGGHPHRAAGRWEHSGAVSVPSKTMDYGPGDNGSG
ncbi:unnamed protein product [Closterium sp. NIES-53]